MTTQTIILNGCTISQSDRNGKAALVITSNKAEKPLVNFDFDNAERRDRYIGEVVRFIKKNS